MASIASLDWWLTTIGNNRWSWLIVSKTSRNHQSWWLIKHNPPLRCPSSLEFREISWALGMDFLKPSWFWWIQSNQSICKICCFSKANLKLPLTKLILRENVHSELSGFSFESAEKYMFLRLFPKNIANHRFSKLEKSLKNNWSGLFKQKQSHQSR